MFKNCKALETIDLSSFDTSSVTNMDSMFSYIASKYLDLRNFNTLKVLNFNNMFEECRGLNITIHEQNCNNMIKFIPEYVNYKFENSSTIN